METETETQLRQLGYLHLEIQDLGVETETETQLRQLGY